MDERYETLLANLTAISAGQQILIDRLLSDTAGGGNGNGKGAAPSAADDAELQRIAHDLRVLLTATRVFLRAGTTSGSGVDAEEEEAAEV